MSMEQTALERLTEEVVNVRHLLEILARDSLKKEIEAVATTSERRRVYALSDGQTSNEQISTKVGVSVRSVQDVVKKLVEMDLVTMVRRGFPKRRFDWVPPDWRVEEPGVEANVIPE